MTATLVRHVRLGALAAAASLVLLVLLGALGAGGCASGRGARPSPAIGLDPSVPPQKIADVPGINTRLFREGRVYIGGQPDSLALRALAQRGVTTVVNLRTPPEVSDRKSVPYDEPALARALGLAYVADPVGGEQFPYAPAVVDTFAAVLARTSGPVYLHCAVGGRASWVWASYLVRHLGWSPQAALDRGRMIGIGPDLLQELSGKRLEVVPR